MAAAIRADYLLPAKAGVRITADGTVTLLQGMTDLGTGTYTPSWPRSPPRPWACRCPK